MQKLKLLIIITNRENEDAIITSLDAYGGVVVNSTYCKGTAKSEIMSILGIGETEKTLIIMSAPEDNVPAIYAVLKTEYQFSVPNHGIAFTVPISAVGGPATYKILNGDFSAVTGGNKNGKRV